MKVKKTMLTKVIAVFAIVAMMLSMSMTAFAISSTDQGDFTVSGLDTTVNPQVTAYQIITVNIDDASGQPKYPMYTWNSEVASWLKTYYPTYVDSTLGINAVADVFDGISADDETVFLEKLTAAIKNGTVSVAASKTVTAAGGSAAFTDMDMGVYLITANGGVMIYQPTTVELVPTYNEGTNEWILNDADAVMKSNNPDIVKTVTDTDKTVAIGDPVNYQLTADVPDYPADATAVKLTVRDTLGTGLTLDAASITVYTGTVVSDQNKVTEGTDTFSTTIDSGNCNTFRIEFAEAFINTHLGEKLTVVYSATVNENAFTTDSLGNEAFIGYSNDPYDESSYREKSDPENVYTYGIRLTKKNASESESLSGAQFEIKKGDAVLKFKKANDGVYTYDSTGSTSVVEVAADGTLLVKGLDAGTYTLRETKAPNGYALPSGEITVVITDNEPDGEIDKADVATSGNVEITGAVVNNTDKNVTEFNVLNNDTDFTLPVTGGMGTMIFTILGIALMAGAVTIIVVSRKKKA